MLFAWFRNNTANTIEDTSTNVIRTELYEGLLQYDKYCFHKQALNCTQKFWAKQVGKLSCFESADGMLNRSTRAIFSLQLESCLQHALQYIYYYILYLWRALVSLQRKLVMEIKSIMIVIALTCKEMIPYKFLQNLLPVDSRMM